MLPTGGAIYQGLSVGFHGQGYLAALSRKSPHPAIMSDFANVIAVQDASDSVQPSIFTSHLTLTKPSALSLCRY